MKTAAGFFWTIIAIILIAVFGRLITADRYETGTYLQFETSRSLIIPTEVTLGASSDSAVYLYKQGSKDTISGIPSGDADNMSFVYEPKSVDPGKWINPTGNSVKYTISSAEPVEITKVDSEPGVTWFLVIMAGFVVWLFVLAVFIL